MSSHQDQYYYSDQSPTSYGSSTDHPVARQSHSPGPSWTPSITTCDQASSQSYPSLDQAGNLLELGATEGMNYSFNQPYPNYSPQGTSFQGTGTAPDATYNDGIHFDFTNFSPASGYYPVYDHRYPQQQSSYIPYQPSHGFLGQSFVHSAQPMSDLTHSFGVFHAQDIHTPQTSQGLAVPAYPYSSTTQPPSLDHGGPVYVEDSKTPRPAIGSVLVTPDVINTASMELSNTDAGQHSRPSPVATSPSNQDSSPGPSRPSPSSPERKRLLPLPADAGSTARIVIPRTHRALSVHSTSSDSHRRRRNVDVPGRGPLIPQDRYSTSSISTYNTAEQHPPITFNLTGPDQIGIPITDILNETDVFSRIRDGTHAFSHMGKKTFTLRVLWRGYKPWSKTIAALDWKKSRAPISRVKLAGAVATGIKNLIEKKRDEACDSDYAEWKIGPDGIELEQLCLVALYQVSRGSWQPELCLLEPRR